MNTLKKFGCLILLISMGAVNAQNLSSHQWKDRILVVMTEDTLNNTFQQQLLELEKNIHGLKERKLFVYLIQPTEFKKGLLSKSWQKNSTLFEKYKNSNSAFEIALIGLDGGIKLQQTDFLSCNKLFSMIDMMPMRRAEMKKND